MDARESACIANTDESEDGRRNAMAKRRLEKAYQVITLEELCGILFGAENGEECLLREWVENTKYRTTYGRGGAGTPGGKAFPQKEQIEIFLTEDLLSQVWSDEDRSELWSDFNKGYGKNYLSEIVLARPKENKVNEARRELSKWLRDDYDGTRMRAFFGHFRDMLGMEGQYGIRNENGSVRKKNDGAAMEKLSDALADLLDREYDFREKKSALEESDQSELSDKKKSERSREKIMREKRGEMRERWKKEQYAEWRQMASSGDPEEITGLLLRMVLYAVLTVERSGDIEEICSIFPGKQPEGEFSDGREKKRGGRDEISGIPEHINEVTATYASRSDSMSEDIIRLVKESREVCGIGVALSELTGMGMVLTKILSEGTKFRHTLLSDPTGEGRRIREIEETGCEDGHIVKSVSQAIENMRILREFSKETPEQIRIRYYQEVPRASIIFFDDRCALIQFYLGAKRGKETPAFLVRNEPGDRIFGFYKRIFEEMWGRAEDREEEFKEE